MMTMSLPIPAKKEPLKFFFVPYDFVDGYMNHAGTVNIRSNDTWQEFRSQVYKRYGKAQSDYTICRVNDNTYKRFYSLSGTVDQQTAGANTGILLLYQNNPLTPSKGFPASPDKSDSNNGIDNDTTRLVVNLATMTKNTNSYGNRFSKDSLIPRLLWLSKKTNMRELHMKVFKFFKHCLGEWLEW